MQRTQLVVSTFLSGFYREMGDCFGAYYDGDEREEVTHEAVDAAFAYVEEDTAQEAEGVPEDARTINAYEAGRRFRPSIGG